MEIRRWRWDFTSHTSLQMLTFIFSPLMPALLFQPRRCEWMKASGAQPKNKLGYSKISKCKSRRHNPPLLLPSPGIRFTVGVTSWSTQDWEREPPQSPRRGSRTWAESAEKKDSSRGGVWWRGGVCDETSRCTECWLLAAKVPFSLSFFPLAGWLNGGCSI